jgi:pimeloyl-ACP methyl ester carboxylesterase
MIAPLASSLAGGVDFLVLLAGPGLTGAEVLIQQNRDLLASEGIPETSIEARMAWMEPAIRAATGDATGDEVAATIEEGLAAVDPVLARLPGVTENPADVAAALLDPWMRAFLRFDPREHLSPLTAPVLALIGSLDVQVSPELNAPALTSALAGNADATVTVLSGLNHLFQNAVTGALSEYVAITETFDPETIDLIIGWILDRFG